MKDKTRTDPNTGYLGGRVSKKMMYAVGGFVGVIVMIIGLAIAGKAHKDPADSGKSSDDSSRSSASSGAMDDVLASAPKTGGVIAADTPVTAPAKNTSGTQSQSQTENQPDTTEDQAEQERLRQIMRIEQLKEQQLEAALGATSNVNVDMSDHQSTPAQQPVAAGQMQTMLQNQSGSDGPQDPNMQDKKIAFSLKSHSNTYLTKGRENPVGQWELKVGTVIPATLISGINSDLPGQVIASVSQNVYDSATHSQILIPQGAKLYGVYDSRISYGQDRLLMAWTRINYPDGTTLELQGMSGADTQGYAGFADQVDHHYWKIFGNALLLGVISGASQAGVSNSGDDSDNLSQSQSINNGVAQQFATTGSTLIQKNLDVQPTIKIRNGYKFNVMLNKDIILAPYQPVN